MIEILFPLKESASLHNKTGKTLMFLKIASKFMNLSNLKGGGGTSTPKAPPPPPPDPTLGRFLEKGIILIVLDKFLIY